MQLSKNFSIAEFTKSQTAERKGINNTPQGVHLEAAKALFENVVQKVRDHFGTTTINSGYRCPTLNAAVGGTATSQHCYGEAADIEVPGVANADLANWIVDNTDFDQVILEFYTPGIPDSGWVHVSYKADGSNRGKALTASRINGKTVYSVGINA
jgi:zinc D-Ala-D-Ala carboxypeptidase|tara:strand:- start:1291 stop:1755 length:465 start_codon:yes stop_codon:yes gene_type:complete